MTCVQFLLCSIFESGILSTTWADLPEFSSNAFLFVLKIFLLLLFIELPICWTISLQKKAFLPNVVNHFDCVPCNAMTLICRHIENNSLRHWMIPLSIFNVMSRILDVLFIYCSLTLTRLFRMNGWMHCARNF